MDVTEMANGGWRRMTNVNFFHFLRSTLSTLRIFHTPHFLHSSFSTLLIFTLRTFHTPAFSTILTFRTLHILYSPHFPQSAFCTLLIFSHSALSTLRTPRIPQNPPFVIQATAVFRRCSHLHESLATLLKYIFSNTFEQWYQLRAWNKGHFVKFFLSSL